MIRLGNAASLEHTATEKVDGNDRVTTMTTMIAEVEQEEVVVTTIPVATTEGVEDQASAVVGPAVRRRCLLGAVQDDQVLIVGEVLGQGADRAAINSPNLIASWT